jgi:hypothetical protein
MKTKPMRTLMQVTGKQMNALKRERENRSGDWRTFINNYLISILFYVIVDDVSATYPPPPYFNSKYVVVIKLPFIYFS